MHSERKQSLIYSNIESVQRDKREDVLKKKMSRPIYGEIERPQLTPFAVAELPTSSRRRRTVATELGSLIILGAAGHFVWTSAIIVFYQRTKRGLLVKKWQCAINLQI